MAEPPRRLLRTLRPLFLLGMASGRALIAAGSAIRGLAIRLGAQEHRTEEERCDPSS